MSLELSALTIRILLLFFPGIIATLLIDKLTERKKEPTIYFFIRAFIYGLISYFTLYILYELINVIISSIAKAVCLNDPIVKRIKLKFFDCLLNSELKFSVKEIIFATGISIVISMLATLIENKNLINKIAQTLRISSKFGENDVWSHVLTSITSDTWIIIRDYDKKLIYEGWPSAFSSNYKENELFLENVTVYDIDSVKLYEIDAMYVTMDYKNIIIEMRKVENNREGEKNGKENR